VYNCLYTSFAEIAGLISTSPNDYFDLSSFSNIDIARKELIKFRLGYSSRGYSSL
jgi:hypothetical protein